MTSVLLVTCAGGHLVYPLIKALKAENPRRRIVGVDALGISTRTASVLDASYIVPIPSDRTYIQSIIQICQGESISCILPGSDDEAQLLASALGRFKSQGIKINTMDEDAVRAVRDKRGIYKVLSQHGLKVPRSYSCDSVEELRSALKNIGFPYSRAILRPNTGRGSRKAFIIEDPVQPTGHPHMCRISASDAESHLKDDEAMFVSEFIEGVQLSIDVLANKGQLVQLASRACLNPERLPYKGNSLFFSDAVNSYVRDVSKILQLHGLLDIDAVLSERGEPYLIEINPRQSGTVAASLVLGIPLITQLEAMLQGDAVQNINPTKCGTVTYDGGALHINPDSP